MKCDKKAFDAISEAFLESLIKTFTVETNGECVCLIDAAAVTRASILMIAMVVRDSETVDTPTKRRKFADEVAQQLRTDINQMKLLGGVKFEHITPEARH